VVDGVSDPLQNHMTSQLYQVCKYVVDPAFYTGGVVIIINLDVWNELPKNLQTLITDIARETLKEYIADIEKEFVRVRKVATDNGMKFTNFSEEDKAWFLKLCTTLAGRTTQRGIRMLLPSYGLCLPRKAKYWILR